MSAIAKVNLTAYEAPSANALKTCTPEFCGRFNYHDIPEYYGGLFKTTSESQAEQELWSSKHRKEFGQTTWLTVWFMLLHGFETKKTSYNQDYDQCCPTYVSLNLHRRETVDYNHLSIKNANSIATGSHLLFKILVLVSGVQYRLQKLKRSC